MGQLRKFTTPDDLPELHEPFWESIRQHAARLQRCDQCGTFRFIPTEICARCGSEDATWTLISGRGVVYTFTVVHRAPTPAYQAEAPYVIVHVEMEEGPRMISNLLGVDPTAVRIGQPVQLVYEDQEDGTSLYKFTA
jgi:uncharacterized protein